MANPVLQPGELEPLKSAIPGLRLPERSSVFADRAQRLRMLADGHPMGAYLAFASRIAGAQQALLDGADDVPLPSSTHLALAREHRLPPLGHATLGRNAWWHDRLTTLLALIRQHATAQGRSAIERLQAMPAAAVERMAGALLDGNYSGVDPAAAPLVGAALQVYWTAMVSRLGRDALKPLDVATVCPACGSPPVASVVRIGGDEQGLRFLACSLCATEWHMVRVKCSHCESTEGIVYYHVEGASDAVKAETCDGCRTYLKVMNMNKDPGVDPVADDLATLALDVLVDAAGFNRVGPNLMLMPGAS